MITAYHEKSFFKGLFTCSGVITQNGNMKKELFFKIPPEGSEIPYFLI